MLRILKRLGSEWAPNNWDKDDNFNQRIWGFAVAQLGVTWNKNFDRKLIRLERSRRMRTGQPLPPQLNVKIS